MPQTLARAIRHEAESVKGSRFLVHARPVSTEVEARAFLADLRQAMPDASHHCSAWRLAHPAIERASDDGEPSGSAGRPILAQLAGRDLVDTALVVTRWFGGTKLGVGGLVRAYGGSAAQALDVAEIAVWRDMVRVTFSHSHAASARVEQAIAAADGQVDASTFGADVEREVILPADQFEVLAATVADLTAGATRIADPRRG